MIEYYGTYGIYFSSLKSVTTQKSGNVPLAFFILVKQSLKVFGSYTITISKDTWIWVFLLVNSIYKYRSFYYY